MNGHPKVGLWIECSHILHNWYYSKSVQQNLAEIGLATDPDKAIPLHKRKMEATKVDVELVWKLSVLNDLKISQKRKGILDCVHYLVQKHGGTRRL